MENIHERKFSLLCSRTKLYCSEVKTDKPFLFSIIASIIDRPFRDISEGEGDFTEESSEGRRTRMISKIGTITVGTKLALTVPVALSKTVVSKAGIFYDCAVLPAQFVSPKLEFEIPAPESSEHMIELSSWS